MKNRNSKLLGTALMLPLAVPLFAQNQQPNILIVFTDDQGYGDFGFTGSTTNKTPVLDRLAAEGTVFTDFYAQHVSGPSRAALLTGRYPIRNGNRKMFASEVTIGEGAKSVGYHTACIGKWDVSGRQEILEQMPNAQGFDYYFGTLGANDGGRVKLYENNVPGDLVSDMGSLTKLYTDKAIDFLENKRDKDRPFLLYVAHTMLHNVVGASDDFKGTSGRSLYGDAVQEMDYETGRLLAVLENEGLRENTLVIFTTDNGPWCQENYIKSISNPQLEGVISWGDPGILRDGKGSCYEGGSRVPCIMSMPGTVPEGVRKDGLISTLDFMPTFAAMCGFEMRKDVVIDGVDQSKFILSKSNKSARKNFCYLQIATIGQVNIEDFKAIRDGRWKLLLPNRKPESEHKFLSDFGTNDYELYDLKNDPSESVNLVDKYPKVVERLKKMHAQMEHSYLNEK